MKTIFALCALLAMLTAWADDNEDIDIYIDYPCGGWYDQSNTYVDQQAIEYRRSHRSSYMIHLEPNRQAKLHHNDGGHATYGYSHLEFWVHGGGANSHHVKIRGADFFTLRTMVNLTDYVTISATEWRRVVIPLTHLGLANVARFNQLYFIEPDGITQPPLYIDDIKVVKPAFAGQVTALVNYNVNRRELNNLLFGVNGATWDSFLTHPDTVNRLKETGFKIVRYPGGATADQYDFRNNRNKRNGEVYWTNTQAFIDVCNQLGAQKLICFNYGSGTPEEAADWVRHANVELNGNVMYWAVGNESYGTWSYDTHSFRQDATLYAQFVRDTIALAKAIDPRIKIGVIGSIKENDFPQRFTVQNPRTGLNWNGWTPVLLTRLREMGITPDFYDIKFYPNSPGREADSHLLQSTSLWNDVYSRARSLLRDYLGPVGDTVPLFIAENNCAWASVGKQSLSLVNALYAADSWANACLIGVDSFMWWNVHNGAWPFHNNSVTLYGWRNYGDFGLFSQGREHNVGAPLNTPYPAYFGFKMINRFAKPGDTLVRADSNYSLFVVHAVKSADTGRLKLMIINKSREQALTGKINIDGYKRPIITSQLKAYRYGREEDANNANIREMRIPFNGWPLVVTVPSYSITVIEL